MIDDSAGDSLWNAAVDAENGRLLDTDDWTSKDTLGQLSARSSAPAAAPSRGRARAVGAAAAAQVADGSSYSVLAFPTESPNDASRQVVTNPADSIASPFGWHDTNGAVGAEFTTTQGQQRPRVPRSGRQRIARLRRQPERRPEPHVRLPGRPQRSTPRTTAKPSSTNLFYGNNRFHDVTLPLRLRRGRPATSRPTTTAAAGAGATTSAPRPRTAAARTTPTSRPRPTDGGHAANADVPLAGQPVREPEPGRRRRVGSFNASWSRFGARADSRRLPGPHDRLRRHGLHRRRSTPAPLPRPTGWRSSTAAPPAASTSTRRVQVAESLGANAVDRRAQHHGGRAGADRLAWHGPPAGHPRGRASRRPTATRSRPPSPLGPTHRQRAQASGPPRDPRRRLRERDHHPRVRARHLATASPAAPGSTA